MAAKRTVNFYYDLVCPYAYIASHRVSRVMASSSDISFNWKPVLLGGLYDATAAPQGKAGSATDVMAPAKKVSLVQDLRRNAAHAEVPLNWNPKHPVKTITALRLILAADPTVQVDLARALYREYWVDGGDLADESTLDKVGKKHGVPLSVLDDPSTKDRASAELRTNTDTVVDLGGFGVPVFHVEGSDQMHWGQDRLFFALQEAGVDSHPPRVLSPSAKPPAKSLTMYHDFSSPWSRIGYKRVSDMALAMGIKINYKPILLGALFKAIGTNNLPMVTMIPAKRDYARQDLHEWAKYAKLELNWPSNFPIRTVTPLRVALVDESVAPFLYHAAWTEDIDIGDEAELRKVLSSAGFDAEELLRAAASDSIKAKLRANTEEAVAAGVCGVPTYQVEGSDELVWGQDRLNVVADMLYGWTWESAPERAKL